MASFARPPRIVNVDVLRGEEHSILLPQRNRSLSCLLLPSMGFASAVVLRFVALFVLRLVNVVMLSKRGQPRLIPVSNGFLRHLVLLAPEGEAQVLSRFAAPVGIAGVVPFSTRTAIGALGTEQILFPNVRVDAACGRNGRSTALTSSRSLSGPRFPRSVVSDPMGYSC